jgi:hypothetical protein
MHKLTVKLSNHPSPLEPEVIPNGLREETILVEDVHDTEEVLNKVEALVSIFGSKPLAFRRSF